MYFTIKNAAKELNMSFNEVAKLVNSGKLPSFTYKKNGTAYTNIPADELLKFKNKHTPELFPSEMYPVKLLVNITGKSKSFFYKHILNGNLKHFKTPFGIRVRGEHASDFLKASPASYKAREQQNDADLIQRLANAQNALNEALNALESVAASKRC